MPRNGTFLRELLSKSSKIMGDSTRIFCLKMTRLMMNQWSKPSSSTREMDPLKKTRARTTMRRTTISPNLEKYSTQFTTTTTVSRTQDPHSKPRKSLATIPWGTILTRPRRWSQLISTQTKKTNFARSMSSLPSTKTTIWFSGGKEDPLRLCKGFHQLEMPSSLGQD